MCDCSLFSFAVTSWLGRVRSHRRAESKGAGQPSRPCDPQRASAAAAIATAASHSHDCAHMNAKMGKGQPPPQAGRALLLFVIAPFSAAGPFLDPWVRRPPSTGRSASSAALYAQLKYRF